MERHVKKSTSTPRPVFLMCRPTFFTVDYEINPWMKVRRKPDPALALRQWAALRSCLQTEFRARVLLVRARPGLPDMTFTANAGLPVDNLFIPARFRHKERAGEEPFFRSWFTPRRYTIIDVPPGLSFEGAGDALPVGDTLFAGYFRRTDVRAHAFLSDVLNRRVLSLELVDRAFYHLDTCFAPAGPSRALWHPPAFDCYSRSVLKENVDDLIPVDAAEAHALACNAIINGNRAVIPAPAPRLAARLRKRGYTVFPIDLSEFRKAGGAAKCLTLQLP